MSKDNEEMILVMKVLFENLRNYIDSRFNSINSKIENMDSNLTFYSTQVIQDSQRISNLERRSFTPLPTDVQQGELYKSKDELIEEFESDIRKKLDCK
jgi:hypothetical protein